jgi:hypothetical protein
MANKSITVKDGVMQIFKGIYTGPIAYRYCYNMYINFNDLATAYYDLIWTSWENSLIFYSENLIFNGIDLYTEAMTLNTSYTNANWG